MRSTLKQGRKTRREKRTRAKIFGTAMRPRLSVYRSLKHIYAQLIDDEKGKTLVAANDLELKLKTKKGKLKTTARKLKEEKNRKNKTAIAYEVGKLIAEKATKKQIKMVVFDRGGFLYHGRIKALADGAREKGLIF